MKKAVMFDWAGVISDSFETFHQVCNMILKKYDREPMSKDFLRHNFTLPYMDFWNEHIPEMSQEEQEDLYREFIEIADEGSMYPNVKETLSFLKGKGYELFVVSADPPKKFKEDIERYELAEYFTEAFSGVYHKNEKISEIIKSNELNPEISFYIGDTTGDIEFGKDAGVKTIGISWGFSAKEKLSTANPDFLIDDIIELKEICKD